MLIIDVYVNDILMLCEDETIIKAVKSTLKRKFLMKDMGTAAEFCGYVIERD